MQEADHVQGSGAHETMQMQKPACRTACETGRNKCLQAASRGNKERDQ